MRPVFQRKEPEDPLRVAEAGTVCRWREVKKNRSARGPQAQKVSLKDRCMSAVTWQINTTRQEMGQVK